MQGIRTRLLLKISRVTILRAEGSGSGGCGFSFSANKMIRAAVSEPRPPRRKAALRSYHWYATPPTKAPMAPPDAAEAAMRPSEAPLLSTPAVTKEANTGVVAANRSAAADQAKKICVMSRVKIRKKLRAAYGSNPTSISGLILELRSFNAPQIGEANIALRAGTEATEAARNSELLIPKR